MRVSALVMMDNLQLQVELLAFNLVLARGMQLNQHWLEMLSLSIREIQYVFSFSHRNLEGGQAYLILCDDIVSVPISILLHIGGI